MRNRLRIALATYSTKPRGGVVHTLALAEALAARGHDVHVWTLGRDGDRTFFRPVAPSVTVHAVPFENVDGEQVGVRILRSIDALRNAFDRAGYDIVHAQDCISANAVTPCLRTVHHLDNFTTAELIACHERAIVEPEALICVSAATASEVRAGWGITAEVIHNGVDAARFAAATQDRTGRREWQQRLGRYVLALGGIEPRKASIDLLDSFAILSTDEAEDEAAKDLKLVFAGGQTLFDYRDYRVRFDRRAQELNVDYEVLGVIDDHRLPTLVAQASTLAFVSVKEGFGLAALEALAAGVPVVARDLPVLREVFGEAVTYGRSPAGIAAALKATLTTPVDPAAGIALAQRFTWELAADKHLAFYRSLLHDRRAAAD